MVQRPLVLRRAVFIAQIFVVGVVYNGLCGPFLVGSLLGGQSCWLYAILPRRRSPTKGQPVDEVYLGFLIYPIYL